MFMWGQLPSAVWPSKARLDFAGSSTEANFGDSESFYYKRASKTGKAAPG
jgi:hypothetical protein